MPVERRSLTGDMFLSIRKESRLNDGSSITVNLRCESPTEKLGKGVALPVKLSCLRQKLGQKAKQAEPAALSLSEREFVSRAPEKKLGLVFL